MDRLPADAENLLKSLIYMQGDASEIDMSSRFEKLTMHQAHKEVLLLHYLSDNGVLSLSGHGLSKTESEGGWEEIARGVHAYTSEKIKTITYPRYVVVTPIGLSYFSEQRREKITSFKWALLAAVLGGLFAWVFSRLLPG